MEKKINVLLSDIKMLYYIEDELLNRLERYGKNKRAEKNEVRKIISKKNNGCMLSKNAQPNVFNKRLSK
ncbi:MAG: hypothetical protein II453_20875 [Alphaproteobacteria bacterium]|nr:hypothetical protein [Alphaproteobacteria bacterium]